jgi:hypothetical protein
METNNADAAREFLPRVIRCPSWCRIGFVVLLYSVSLFSQITADEQSGTKPLRFDVTPLIGYRTIMNFPIGQQQGPGLILDAKPSYGLAVGMRLNEEDLIEIRWARQYSYAHLEGAAPSSNEKVTMDQFHGDFTHEYILENWSPRARPFVMGSVGATRIAGGPNNNSFNRFSFGLGGGIKFYFTRHLGWRIQGEWLPIVVSPEVGSFVCGGGCVVQLSVTAVSQGEIVSGPLFRF